MQRIPSAKAQKSRRTLSVCGFTLLELIVAMTLSTLVMGLTLGLYATVQRAGGRVVTAEANWVALQFFRTQLAHQDRTLNKTFGLVRMERDRLAFITRKSAKFGIGGPPVLALYRLDAGKLSYREVTLPAWWPGKDHENQFNFNLLHGERGKRGERGERGEHGEFEGILFPTSADAAFSYWDEGKGEWREQGHGHNTLPRGVRFRGNQEVVMQTSSLAPYSRAGK